ncbi:MAG: isoleucine--tRNA ligase, partial [Planctomycetota bacterium]
ENSVFGKSLDVRRSAPRFVFYEGPPTANGRPHVGHLIPRILKDVFPRYKTMRGFLVERKGGWDTHGLPVELEVEKELGLHSKSEIESYGTERFVEKCKESVWRYKAAWEEMMRRYGFWIDLEHPYITLDDDYIESLWWALANAFDRGLLYRGHKVVPYCARCGTPLSSHEVAQGYALVKDPSVFLRFPLADEPGVSLLVWTTTPWTLPSNMALAVGPAVTYAKVAREGETLIVARALAERIFGGSVRVLSELPADALVGRKYVPPFDFYGAGGSAHVVVPGDFVTTTEGTGIVHVAPAFGQDDYEVCRKHSIPVFQPVDPDGTFTAEAGWLAGRFVKDADSDIIADLEGRGVLFRKEQYEHDYPFCWRCDAPLLYYARSSWFLAMTAFRDSLLENNRTISWYPDHIRDGRFGDFLENVVDWAVSRERFWGTPLPIWVCSSCEHQFAVGSRLALVERALDKDLARSVELHRPFIDAVKLACPKCSSPACRVSEVVDCWFDSGCMHTAQFHYPFENADLFKLWYPADFIAEAQDQTRGWFYTLLATSTLLYGSSCYRNVICTGLGLDREGNKMSKSRGNIIDPVDIVERVGADAVRWYMCTVTMPWNSRPFDEVPLGEVIRGLLGTLRNVCSFFSTYACLDGFDPLRQPLSDGGRTLLDRWILHRLDTLVREVRDLMDAYDVTHGCRAIERFVIDDLSNWYVRLGRSRFWKSQASPEKSQAYASLYHCIAVTARLIAPIAPFLAEEIHQKLLRPCDPDGPESVHLVDFPVPDDRLLAPEVAAEMDAVRIVSKVALCARNSARIKIRQPLSELALSGPSRFGEEAVALLARELNVKKVSWFAEADRGRFLVLRVALEHGRVGPRYGRLTEHLKLALSRLGERDLALFRESGRIDLSVEGREVPLTAEDVRFIEEPRPGFSFASEGAWWIALDTEITADLRVEGLAREFIRQVQVARKDSGFRVEDRIELYVTGPDELLSAVERHADAISAEVLALSLRAAPAPAGDFRRCAVKVDGMKCDVAMRVVPRAASSSPDA